MNAGCRLLQLSQTPWRGLFVCGSDECVRIGNSVSFDACVISHLSEADSYLCRCLCCYTASRGLPLVTFRARRQCSVRSSRFVRMIARTTGGTGRTKYQGRIERDEHVLLKLVEVSGKRNWLSWPMSVEECRKSATSRLGVWAATSATALACCTESTCIVLPGRQQRISTGLS